jgi:hypothetical protein
MRPSEEGRTDGADRVTPRSKQGDRLSVPFVSAAGISVSFAGFPVLQRDSLLPQACGRLLCQRDFYWISYAQVPGCTA